MFGLFKWHRRKRLRAAPFPADWLKIIETNVRYYACLPDADRRELEWLIQIFLAEKNFEGCGGLILTDEIKLTIAAQACLLILHRNSDIYPKLTTVIVYPSAYVVKNAMVAGTIVPLEGEFVHLGESWTLGIVVLSWDEIRAGILDIEHGKNLVLHEFAHQLDWEDGAVDGIPRLDRPSQYRDWTRVFTAEYDRLKRDTWAGRHTVLDEYGTTNPAEFFAVATECFFEKPRVLQKSHPELYAQLRSVLSARPRNAAARSSDRA